MPKTVIAAKPVQLMLVRYVDGRGQDITQLALVGDNTVHLLDSRGFGISQHQTPQGIAADWLRDAIKAKVAE